MKYISLHVVRIPEVQLSREDGVFPLRSKNKLSWLHWPMPNNNANAIIM